MEDEINLLDYIRVINKRKWLIISLCIVSALLTLIFSLSQNKMYRATATIMSTESGGGGLSAALSAMPFLGGGGGSGAENKLIPILKSKTLAKNVVADFNLMEVAYKGKVPRVSSEQKLEGAGGILQGAIDAKTSSSGLLEISIIWTDPKIAAEIANNYISELGKFLNSRSLNVNFQVIDPAVPPLQKFKPKTVQNVLISAVLGIFIGIFIAFFMEYLDNIKNQVKI